MIYSFHMGFKNGVTEDTIYNKPKIHFDIKYKDLNRNDIGLHSISNSKTNTYRMGNNDMYLSSKFLHNIRIVTESNIEIFQILFIFKFILVQTLKNSG